MGSKGRMMTDLADQQKRAHRLSEGRRCSHCRHRITLLDALSMVRGHGYRYHVRVVLPDGQTVLVEEREFNPQTMLWAGNAKQK